MAAALELCAELGFLDTSREGPSRGLPKVLLDDMKTYAKFRRFVRDAVLLADAYLYAVNAGEKHWPSAETPQWGFLAWGADNGRIEELVTALFDLIMNSERAERMVIDLEDDGTMTSNGGNEQQAGGFQTLAAAEPAQTATGVGQSHIGAIQVEDHSMIALEDTKQPIKDSQVLL
ncbi:hypothetical protein N7G274_004037 [Stereocaulon virgatum]|uniref:Uncharacterized protein n=1 Tax=Stereocaulon virgatum TaxID=373712 RepID=A0ABR4AE42_9LECA